MIRNAYYSNNSIALIRSSTDKVTDIFLTNLVKQGLIQGFEARHNVLVVYLKHEKTGYNKILPRFKVFRKQAFKKGYTHSLSALEKMNRGLSGYKSFVSSDRGILSLEHTCQKKIGGKLLYSTK